MQTHSISNGSRLKDTLKDDHTMLKERQDRLTGDLRTYIRDCNDVSRIPCSALMLDLLSGNAHLAVDEVYEMKQSITDILVLLTDQEVAQKFKAIKGFYSDNFAQHLKRILYTIDRAGNTFCLAEMALSDLESFELNEQYLTSLESDFEAIL